METQTNSLDSGETRLRDISAGDLAVFFEQQLDREANQMAAFTARDPADRDAFMAHWNKILADSSVAIKTVLVNDAVAGYVSRHSWFGEPEVTYWIGKQYWGKGVATRALAAFLTEFGQRPIFARVAKDNVASIRVLEKCGFVISGEGRGFANARGEEIEEFIMVQN